jgi:hypothetical protein
MFRVYEHHWGALSLWDRSRKGEGGIVIQESPEIAENTPDRAGISELVPKVLGEMA